MLHPKGSVLLSFSDVFAHAGEVYVPLEESKWSTQTSSSHWMTRCSVKFWPSLTQI